MTTATTATATTRSVRVRARGSELTAYSPVCLRMCELASVLRTRPSVGEQGEDGARSGTSAADEVRRWALGRVAARAE